MAEQDTIFSNQFKYSGIFNFKEFYKFCYEWLTQEIGASVLEKKYTEKIEANGKEINVEWEGLRKATDYFKFKWDIKFEVTGLEKIEINQDGKKIKTNKGSIKISIKGILIRDYEGKFEKNAWQIFLRNAYEKWIIPSRIDEFEGKIFGSCEKFLAQAKAYLDIEGKR